MLNLHLILSEEKIKTLVHHKQGTVLGPLLFIIYINGLCVVSNEMDNELFAGDTTVHLSDHSL